MLTVEGYFKPDEWVDQQGTKHNRIVFIANKFYPTPDKEETPAAEPEKPTKKGVVADFVSYKEAGRHLANTTIKA